MNDVIYAGSIPSDYHFARFSNDYIDLFKVQSVQGVQDYYRIHLYERSFQCEHLTNNFDTISPIQLTEVETSNDWHYRRDLPEICFLGLVEIMIIIIIFNIVSSVFKKGGLLSGLL